MNSDLRRIIADTVMSHHPLTVSRGAGDSVIVVLEGLVRDTLIGRASVTQQGDVPQNRWVCGAAIPLIDAMSLYEFGWDTTLTLQGSWQLAVPRPVE